MAIEKNDTSALFNLGLLYYSQKKYEEAEKYFLRYENEDEFIFIFPTSSFLPNVYIAQKKYEKAEEYYLKLIEEGYIEVFVKLGELYYKQKKFDETEKYFKLAFENGDLKAIYLLANLYKELKKI